MLQIWQAEGFLDPVSNRLAPESARIALGSSRIAPYRSVSHSDRLVSRRIAAYRARIVSSRTVSPRLAPYRSVSHRIVPSRTESDHLAPSPNRLASESNRLARVLLLAPVWEFSCQITPVCFLHSLQAKVPCSLSNLTPVCVGVLLGLCSTSGPPWCSLWPSIVGGNHVAFAVLPAERNLSTTHLFGKSQNQWSLFLHTSFLQGVYSREL